MSGDDKTVRGDAQISFVELAYPAQGVALVTLARPDRMNAMSMAMVEHLIEALHAVRSDPSIGSFVLTGEGRGFCTGGDVKEMLANRGKTLQQRHDDLARMHEIPQLIVEMPQVAIAAVNGAAYGAGMAIALTCDVALASDSATFRTAFLKQGLVSDFGLSYQLTRLAGSAAARRLIYLDPLVAPSEAQDLGLVSQVEPGALLLDEAVRMAEAVAALPADARVAMKALLHHAETETHRAMLDAEAEMQGRFIVSRDHADAVDAFHRRTT